MTSPNAIAEAIGRVKAALTIVEDARRQLETEAGLGGIRYPLAEQRNVSGLCSDIGRQGIALLAQLHALHANQPTTGETHVHDDLARSSDRA